jgi:cytochrome P450
VGDVVYNPFDHVTVDNPYPVYRRLRDEAPVYHNPDVGFWALSRYDDVLAAHLDAATFSSAHGVTIEDQGPGAFLITKDAPQHTWHRKIVSRVFTPRRVSGLEPFIRRTARDLLDRVSGDGRLDAVAEFALLLPLTVIGELLDLPADYRHEVHVLSDKLAARTGEPVLPDEAQRAFTELRQLYLQLVTERRRRPGDDVVSLLITTAVEDDEGDSRMMSDDEIADRYLELGFAGHETVTKLLANAIVGLAWYPDQRRELIADRSLLPNAVEELLRWDPPSHYQGRWTTRPVEMHGTTIPADVRVILITGSAGHDERRFADPELLDLHRQVDRHVSFGFGSHLCLGAALARLETRVALDEFLDAFPDYDIGESGVVRAYQSNVRGLQHLPVVAAPARV